jgi:hypothetical protein
LIAIAATTAAAVDSTNLVGKTVLDSISDIAGGTWYQIVVTSFILLLVLIPYFAFRALGDVVGHQILVRLFFEPNRSGIDSSRP